MSPHTDTSEPALLRTDFPTLPPPRRGKVRDIYDFGHTLLIVATDRISVFDVVLPTGIPGKGKILTQLSCFWFEHTQDLIPNHLLTADARVPPGKPAGRSVIQPKAASPTVMDLDLVTVAT